MVALFLFVSSLLLLALMAPERASGQTASADSKNTIRGVVVNRVTREPLGRALVYSADKRLATLTDDQGRFQFVVLPAPETLPPSVNETVSIDGATFMGASFSSFPGSLLARKPGFLSSERSFSPWDLVVVETGKDIIIALTPEARIVGRVVLPSSNAADRIIVHLYRRRVSDGRAVWEMAADAASRSNGEFRFAGLDGGTYRLFTGELMDRDPLTFNPAGPVYGYPPSYFPDASNFQAAADIHLAAGMTFQADLSPVRQPYYNVKLPIANALAGEQMLVSVAIQGRKGPGFELGYNPRDQRVEGSLPNGTYLIEATSQGQNGDATGSAMITVKGAPVEGPAIAMVPNGSVSIETKLELTQDDQKGSVAIANPTQDPSTDVAHFALLPGGNLTLEFEPADEFLNPQSGPRSESRKDKTITYGSVAPGRYWMKVRTQSGFAASMRSGDVDLLRHPLTVLPGANLRVDVELRNDGAEISGTIEGAKTQALPASTMANLQRGFLYCVPLPDSPGQFRETQVGQDGSFQLEQLPPGSYRVLVFDRPQTDFEFRNPEAMRAFENKGQVVRLTAGQKEHLTLQLIPINE
ncbi:MAG TPA: hypothetical protein VLL05_21325 [Terriglobales bacterium]|nr:hypothetical protein [Terriglobales bacterium]